MALKTGEKVLLGIGAAIIGYLVFWKGAPVSQYLVYLPFDEGSGDIAYDGSGHGHDAMLHNTMWAEIESRAAIYFKGAGSYAEIADAPELNPEGDFWVEAYVCPMFPPGMHWSDARGAIAKKGRADFSPQANGWLFQGGPDYATFIPYYSYYDHSVGLPGGEGFKYINTISLPAREWSHIRFEVLPSLGETWGYVNGKLERIVEYPKGLTRLTSPGEPLYMGVGTGGSVGYYGFVNELKMGLT